MPYNGVPMAKSDTARRRVRIAGQVQGVGFRPYVYRLAAELRLTGWVGNDAAGVTIEVQGRPAAVEAFLTRLPVELPPLASIARLETEAAEPLAGEKHFEVTASAGGEMTDAQVTVDTAVCDDCLREMADPADPRYGYPFINCTNCGPRYTIVTRIPYDRPNTTMADFAMCKLCAGEYADPANRRFHAQPVACPQCGPALWLVDPRGRQIACAGAIGEAARRLLDGRIVAIKGLGGFHLACRADDDHAVRRLRERKRRDAKPFALMVADLAAANCLCEIAPDAEKLLAGPLRPIVLLPRRQGADVAPAVAEGLNTLGLMLPYAPLHHLLFDRLRAAGGGEPPPLVMTSGNYSDEPLVKDNDAAVAHLSGIADVLLLHNRRIARRLDDSVAQVHADGQASVLRRARGYAPQPVRVGTERTASPVGGISQSILAVGAELKSGVCLYRDGRAVLGEHIGDLKDGRTYRHFIATIDHLEKLFDVRPALLAADLHPRYLSTEYALRRHRGELPGREAVPIVRVQHHHAHVAACLAENAHAGEAIGLVCDGVGYGDDGAVWGCEVLRADFAGYERLGHLRYLPLIGGDAAASETWRPAVAALNEAFGEGFRKYLPLGAFALEEDRLAAAEQILTIGANTPPASSLGRWFDAVAWLTGVAAENRYEGEAPMRLEAAVRPGVEAAYPYRFEAAGPFQIDLRSMTEAIIADLAKGTAAGEAAAKFHNTAAAFLRDAARRAREVTGLATVALTGGCFANRYLTARLSAALTDDGFTVLRHRTIPCNDGGVALGQAVVAAAKAAARKKASVYNR